MLIAAGTADGSCILMNGNGETIGRSRARKWVHSVSVRDGAAFIALGTGMQGVHLVDGRNMKPVWSTCDPSPVHNVALTPDNKVLSVGCR